MHTWQQRGTFGRANFGLFSSFIDPVTDSMVPGAAVSDGQGASGRFEGVLGAVGVLGSVH